MSVVAGERGRALYKYLTEKGVVADWREPDVIRMAPAPLYNSFTDVYHLGVLLHKFFVS